MPRLLPKMVLFEVITNSFIRFEFFNNLLWQNIQNCYKINLVILLWQRKVNQWLPVRSIQYCSLTLALSNDTLCPTTILGLIKSSDKLKPLHFGELSNGINLSIPSFEELKSLFDLSTNVSLTQPNLYRKHKYYKKQYIIWNNMYKVPRITANGTCHHRISPSTHTNFNIKY